MVFIVSLSVQTEEQTISITIMVARFLYTMMTRLNGWNTEEKDSHQDHGLKSPQDTQKMP